MSIGAQSGGGKSGKIEIERTQDLLKNMMSMGEKDIFQNSAKLTKQFTNNVDRRLQRENSVEFMPRRAYYNQPNRGNDVKEQSEPIQYGRDDNREEGKWQEKESPESNSHFGKAQSGAGNIFGSYKGDKFGEQRNFNIRIHQVAEQKGEEGAETPNMKQTFGRMDFSHETDNLPVDPLIAQKCSKVDKILGEWEKKLLGVEQEIRKDSGAKQALQKDLKLLEEKLKESSWRLKEKEEKLEEIERLGAEARESMESIAGSLNGLKGLINRQRMLLYK
jgi:hypothetical protein